MDAFEIVIIDRDTRPVDQLDLAPAAVIES
jgi:hypothetical protein